MKAIVLGYHSIGCIGIDALLADSLQRIAITNNETLD